MAFVYNILAFSPHLLIVHIALHNCSEDGLFLLQQKTVFAYSGFFCPLLINEPLLTFPTGLYITMFNKARLCIYIFLSSTLYLTTTV